MELKKQPKTEIEYWQAIEGLGGIAWKLNHDLADGRIDDPDGSANKTIMEATELLTKLVSELSEKFGIISPKDCPKTEIGQKPPKPPKGKKYYWEWYRRMKKVYYHMEHEKTICSACPFSMGAGESSINCSVFPGTLYRLHRPYQCGMIEVGGEWNEAGLREKLLKKGGEVALIRFRIKEAGLRALFNLGSREIDIPD